MSQLTCLECIHFSVEDFGANEWEIDEKNICMMDFPPLSEKEIKAILDEPADFDPLIASECQEYEHEN